MIEDLRTLQFEHLNEAAAEAEHEQVQAAHAAHHLRFLQPRTAES